MDSGVIFGSIIVFLSAGFLLERLLDGLNMRCMSSRLPESLKGIYDEKEYERFQNYKRETNRFNCICSAFSFIVLIVFLSVGGFGWYNAWIVGITDNLILQTLLFMLGLLVASTLAEMPFDWYATFRIEEKFGFNKTTLKTWGSDALKSLLLSVLIGGIILTVVVWFYKVTGIYFWYYAWAIISLFSLFMALFYSRLIVPLFNKQFPLESGNLRDKIETLAQKTGFKLKNIYVIDGSRRSTKANAYFTGFGPEKRVVLYDTLLKDLTEEEIVAVLAHEIGHYRKHHTLQFMLASLLQTGILLWLFSLLVNEPALSEALGGERVYFQLGLVAFVLLYTPLSIVTGLGMNAWSRKNEYEADAFAAEQEKGEELIAGLKKISVKALSNLTPHPWYEFVYYSHPSLLKRIAGIEKQKRINKA